MTLLDTDAGSVTEKSIKKNIIRRLYDWVLGWAETPYGTPALFTIAFAESSFFPVAPDILLIALDLSRPKRSFYYALLCSIASVLGGIFGYFIGLELMDLIGFKIIQFYGVMNQYEQIKELYKHYDALAVFIAGFTPIPYKIATITAGAFKINFITFVVASVLSRGARFFLVSGLIYLFGARIKEFIDKYFNMLVVIFTILLIGGIIITKLLVK
jgi:membrane protein YqaA with SNARE-associated domain